MSGESSLRIAIGRGPECPKCHEDGFDDWWRDAGVKSPGGPIVALAGRLKCHGCGRFFAVMHYHDGETHSTMRCAA